MYRLRTALVAAFLAVVLLLPSWLAWGDRFGVEPAGVVDAIERVLADGDYQTALPGERQRDSSMESSWLVLLSWVMRFGFIAIVIVVVALLLAWLLRAAWMSRTVTLREPTAGTAWAASGLVLSDRPLAEVAELAAQGRYAEAVHRLLLLTIEELRAQLRYDAPRALTSREIAQFAPLPGTARPHLDALVGRAELHRFGGQRLDQAAYEASIADFQLLQRACVTPAEA